MVGLHEFPGKRITGDWEELTLLVLLCGDPHLLERAEASEDTATDPGRVLALGRGADPDLGLAQRELLDLVQ